MSPESKQRRAGSADPGVEVAAQTPRPYLFHHHPELALGAEHRLDPRQPLDTGEDLGGADEHLARVEAVGIVKEETLRDVGPGESLCDQASSADGALHAPPTRTLLSQHQSPPPPKASTLPKTNPKVPEHYLSNLRCISITWRAY